MPGTPPYAELHCHSAYSFLDGASRPGELVERALQLGYRALALTDHDSLSGAMELAMAARGTPLKPIFGAEITVRISPDRRRGRRRHSGPVQAPGDARDGWRHLTLLVRDRRGWSNLCRLITLAHLHTRDGPSRSAGQPSVRLDQVLERSEGLLCLSGCAEHGIDTEPELSQLLDAFGGDSLRLELQRPYARHDRARGRALERLARRLGVRMLATGDVHAHTAERALLQDAFAALRCGLTLDSSEAARRPNHAHVIAAPEAMAARFKDHRAAAFESVAIAESIEFDLTNDLGYSYPGAERADAAAELKGVCEAAFSVRYPRGCPHHAEAAARLQGELATIDRLGLSGFFLLHHEIFELATEAAAQVRGGDGARSLLAPGRGRGSSVSSIVCYLTGLSHVDPIASELAIGRFLHEEIKTLPDIDLDFPRDVRERLIPMVHRRYGHERSALVAAFPTFRARGAIRELGKVLGLPPGEIERLARSADGWGGAGAVSEAIKAAFGPERLASGRWMWLARLAEEARGLPRHLSQHSGGMIVATRPLLDCCPIVPAAMEARQIAQWDKDSCADAGFLKIDLLGLGMLSAIERCVQLIASRSGEMVDLSRIPFDDEETFGCIQEAETTGVFQIESRAQMGSLRRTRPQTLADLTVQVAIVRPGPIVGGAVNPYIERRRKTLADPDYEVPYLHPSLRGPLEQTLGTIVFQDQVIEVAQAFAGFSTGRAESLRRAMSRKRSAEAMERHHREFVDGAIATHPDVDRPLAEQVWRMVAGFAGFGFPKAHGAAFGLLAYQSTWLRVHHPVEFLCALLNEQPMGFYAPDSLIHEAQRRGIAVLGPDVGESELQCTIDTDGAIRVGLGYVKGLSAEDGMALLRSRQAGGPFKSLQDLAGRGGLGRSTLSLLAWAGACDALAGGGPAARRIALWQVGLATPAYRLGGGPRGQGAAARSRGDGAAARSRGDGAAARSRGDGTGSPPTEGERQGAIQLALDLELPGPPPLSPLSEWEAMLADYASTNVSIARHPLSLLRERLAREGVLSSSQLAGVRHGERVRVAGLVIARQRPGTANGVTFLLLEDEDGTVNLILPPPLYERRRALVRGEPLLIAAGRLERHADGGGAINVLAAELQALAVDDQGAPASSLQERRRRRGAAGPPGADTGAGSGAPGRDGAAETASTDFKVLAPAVTSFAQGRRR